MTLDISLPEEFLEYFNNSSAELQKLNRLLLAIELYLEEQVSLSKAAELSGLNYGEFQQELAKRKIKRQGSPLTVEEARQNFDTLQQLKQGQ